VTKILCFSFRNSNFFGTKWQKFVEKNETQKVLKTMNPTVAQLGVGHIPCILKENRQKNDFVIK